MDILSSQLSAPGSPRMFPINRAALLFRAETALNNLVTQAVNRCSAGSRISTAHWCPNRRSVRVRLNLSTMAWSRWISVRPRRMLVCVSPFLTLQRPWILGQDRSKAVVVISKCRAVKSLEVKGSVSLKRLATTTIVKAYLYVFRPRPQLTTPLSVMW